MDLDADNRKWDVLLNSAAQVVAPRSQMGKLNEYRDFSSREWAGINPHDAACMRQQAAVDAVLESLY